MKQCNAVSCKNLINLSMMVHASSPITWEVEGRSEVHGFLPPVFLQPTLTMLYLFQNYIDINTDMQIW